MIPADDSPLVDLAATSRSRAPRFYRRAHGPYSGSIYTPDHHLYDRVELPRVEIHELCAVPGIVEYTLVHDRRRCAPFGVFLVYRHHADKMYFVGSSLSNPSLSDCDRLSRDHVVRTRRDPTLPAPLTVLRPTTYAEDSDDAQDL